MKPINLFTISIFAACLYTLPVLSQSVLNDNFYNNISYRNFTYSENTKANVIQTSSQAPNWFYLGEISNSNAGSVSELYFSIPQKLQVRITLMDMMGQEIDEIINSLLSEGTYKIAYDVSKFSQGVYTYKLQTAGYSEMKKMLLIK